jgi:hypothetical protein
LCRLSGQDDGEDGEYDRSDGEAEPGSCALPEVVSDEGAVDAGADRASEDDEVGTQCGGPHLRITVPSMSSCTATKNPVGKSLTQLP